MTTLEKLIKHFERFPGVGGRQAQRFAYHLLSGNADDVAELATLINDLKGTVARCHSCQRYFTKNGSGGDLCEVCSDTARDHTKLMVVHRDPDIQAIERSGLYDGLYFVLGGSVPLLDSDDVKKLNGGAFKQILEERLAGEGIHEVILAFAVNPDGENTARYVRTLINDVSGAENVTVSLLGRGLSTGSELEYADTDTIKNALQNRS